LEGSPQPPYGDGVPPYRGHTGVSVDDQGHTHWNNVVRDKSIPSLDGQYHRLMGFAFRQRYIHQLVTGGINTPNPTFAFYSSGGGPEYVPGTRYDSSTRNLYQVEVKIPADMAVDGRVNYSGFTNKHGEIISASEAGPDAVPVRFINAVPGNYLTNYPGPADGPFNDENFFQGNYYFDADGNASRNPQNGRPAAWIGERN